MTFKQAINPLETTVTWDKKWVSLTAKCGYCYNSGLVCRVVQLSHDTSKEKNWQSPISACDRCREYLRGQYRYAKPQ